MNRQPVQSSMLASVGHDGDTLHVEFKGGKVYAHTGVSAERFQQMLAADSIGKHYNEHIKGKFPHTLLPAEVQP